MRDYIHIGPSPCDENCAQVGQPNYDQQSRKECQAYVDLIRRHLGNEPEGASLKIKSFPHDFGMYREVICYYDDEIQESVDYAFKCESDAPENWDKQSLLILSDFPAFSVGAVLQNKYL